MNHSFSRIFGLIPVGVWVLPQVVAPETIRAYSPLRLNETQMLLYIAAALIGVWFYRKGREKQSERIVHGARFGDYQDKQIR